MTLSITYPRSMLLLLMHFIHEIVIIRHVRPEITASPQRFLQTCSECRNIQVSTSTSEQRHTGRIAGKITPRSVPIMLI